MSSKHVSSSVRLFTRSLVRLFAALHPCIHICVPCDYLLFCPEYQYLHKQFVGVQNNKHFIFSFHVSSSEKNGLPFESIDQSNYLRTKTVIFVTFSRNFRTYQKLKLNQTNWLRLSFCFSYNFDRTSLRKWLWEIHANTHGIAVNCTKFNHFAVQCCCACKRVSIFSSFFFSKRNQAKVNNNGGKRRGSGTGSQQEWNELSLDRNRLATNAHVSMIYLWWW